jgi:DNA topoisomerase IA
MRTDSTRVAEGALTAVRGYIQKTFGNDYLPPEAIHYRSKKGAQDAHEAIRPTDVLRTPDSLRKVLSADEFKLYKLIWQRFVASQMTPAVFDQTTIDIAAGDYTLRATGSVEKFNGFRAVYEEGKDEKAEMEEDEELKHRLPQVERRASPEAAQASAGTALHRAAPALQRSHAGEDAGGKGHRHGPPPTPASFPSSRTASTWRRTRAASIPPNSAWW